MFPGTAGADIMSTAPCRPACTPCGPRHTKSPKSEMSRRPRTSARRRHPRQCRSSLRCAETDRPRPARPTWPRESQFLQLLRAAETKRGDQGERAFAQEWVAEPEPRESRRAVSPSNVLLRLDL